MWRRTETRCARRAEVGLGRDGVLVVASARRPRNATASASATPEVGRVALAPVRHQRRQPIEHQAAEARRSRAPGSRSPAPAAAPAGTRARLAAVEVARAVDLEARTRSAPAAGSMPVGRSSPRRRLRRAAACRARSRRRVATVDRAARRRSQRDTAVTRGSRTRTPPRISTLAARQRRRRHERRGRARSARRAAAGSAATSRKSMPFSSRGGLTSAASRSASTRLGAWQTYCAASCGTSA